ncbi:RND family efflux transporter, MFP subunit [Myxococcus fulvus]|uniref:RND family efflux transporter, MFP subunit n=1 Tax=Myxococcus fulvus TaxID=33 RepID=A0A511TCG6_MYXFU|nr:efflux RND transporter periplasmic adaptor subunit [Myxococcus fulvus]AKF80312.1 hemolysin D [Myxococcus fulvus 124B02]GEN11876.1 resistance-nodulation-cell division (RND) efflux membrane fusion protein [Myxococcus fulvus]SEU38699.1 RND family efflux transporter, MFP subunit [Myxococcus fulvus]
MTKTTLKAAVVVAAVVAGAACGGGKATPPAASAQVVQKPVGVRAVAPAPKLEASVLQATGNVRARQEATLSAEGTGPLTRIAVDVGDAVKKGQVLAQLDTTNARLAVNQAKASRAAADAALEGAKTEVERARTLAQSGSLAKASLDKAEVGYRQAQAQAEQTAAALATAQEALRDATLTAPFDGVITSRSRNEGDYVTPGTAVFGLVNPHALEVRAPVPEALVDRVKVGTLVKGALNPSGAPFEAKVRSLGAVIDPQTRTVEVLADVVPAKGEGPLLRAGALVELDFSGTLAADEAQAGLFLPSQAVNARGQQGFVWVVQDGKAQRRDVKVERVLPGYVRVVQGLGLQERVVADASLPLQNGTALQVVQ